MVQPGERVTIEVPRTPPVAVRAVPVWSAPERGAAGPALASGESLCYAGAVWPTFETSYAFHARRRPAGVSREGSDGAHVLDLTFEDGPATEVVWRLMEARLDVRDLSVGRLRREIRDRLANDPWSLDVERVVEAIASRAMRQSYIRPPELLAVDLVAPPGRWYARSPFVDVVAGGSTWPKLPEGMTPFYSADGRRTIVKVDAEGRAWQPEAIGGFSE